MLKRFILSFLICFLFLCACSTDGDDEAASDKAPTEDDQADDDNDVDDDDAVADDDSSDDDDIPVQRIIFVQDGKPLSVRYDGEPWYEQPGVLQGQGNYRFLHGDYKLLDDDFTIFALLTVDDSSLNPAALLVNGNNRIAFSLKTGTLKCYGPLFTDDAVEIATDALETNQPFELALGRRGEILYLTVDREVIYSQPLANIEIGSLGFEPGNATISLVDFWAEGKLIPLVDAPDEQQVFISGNDGYGAYRIPALAVTPSGTLLAFAEGRVAGTSDTGNIDLVLRRSFDGGKTWQPLQVVVDQGFVTCGNPSPIVERESGDIVLAFTTNEGWTWEPLIQLGIGGRQAWITRSSDDGATWSEPIDISASVKTSEMRWYATGPGHGIQTMDGRLVVPCDHTLGSGDDQYFSHAIFSDDGGESWQLGAAVPGGYTNESIVVDLADGSLLLNMRNMRGTHRRAISYSDDGGESWSAPVDDLALTEPVCQGTIARYSFPEGDEAGRILFANPAAFKREVMAVRLSYDEGVSWPVYQWVHLGPSAYSDIAVLPDGDIGLLYERGDEQQYETISFSLFTLAWLTDGRDATTGQ